MKEFGQIEVELKRRLKEHEEAEEPFTKLTIALKEAMKEIEEKEKAARS